jgi:prepilin signal peptidase PulO-like enzyme (type II secretory pathway)
MGGGDRKLGVMIGTFLGPKLAILAIFSGAFLSGVFAAVLGLRGNPYGKRT